MKTTNFLKMAALAGLSMGFFACDDDWIDCIYGNGEYDEIERELSDFDEIELNGPFDVEIYSDNSHSAEISGDENVVDLVITRVVGDKLILDYDADCVRPKKEIKVKLFMEELNELEINGSGNVSSRDFLESRKLTININGSGNVNLDVNTDDLRVDIEGSGDVDLEGKGSFARYYVDGSGDIDAIDFETDSCSVTIDASGDVSAWVNNWLDVRILGSGDLEYIGDAKLNVLEDKGSGTITKL